MILDELDELIMVLQTGKRWRLLDKHESVQAGDEWYDENRNEWRPSFNWDPKHPMRSKQSPGRLYRRPIQSG